MSEEQPEIEADQVATVTSRDPIAALTAEEAYHRLSKQAKSIMDPIDPDTVEWFEANLSPEQREEILSKKRLKSLPEMLVSTAYDILRSLIPKAEPTPKKKGGQEGNANRLSHGKRQFLRMSRMPAGMEFLERRRQAFRRELEAAVLKKYSKIRFQDHVEIDRATRHEGLLLLSERWLREGKDLTLEQRRALAADIARCTEARNRAVTKVTEREINFFTKDDDTDE